TLELDCVAPFKLDRREPAGVSVTPHRVVEHLDVLEHVLAGGVAARIDSASNALALEQLEEALGHRVVVAVPTPAHARHQTVSLQEGLPVVTAVLAALVRVDNDFMCRSHDLI